MTTSLLKVLGFMFFFTTHLYAQIEIDWTEIPQEVGISFSHNGAESVSVDLGATGGPQSWDFTSQPMGVQNIDALIVPRASTPFGDSFPNSNLVLEITESGYLAYAYGQLTPTFGANLGMASTAPVTAFFRFEPADSYPLPIVYGASRQYAYGYTVELSPIIELRTDSYGIETVDAYGLITVPYGTHECLRVQQFDTTISTMYVSGIPITADTADHIIYEFLAEDYGLIAHIQSYAGETDTNFADAELLERITGFSTGIEERNGQLNAGVHLNISPNPTHGNTQLRCMIHDPGYNEDELRNSNSQMRKTTLVIYDAVGRSVKSVDLESSIVNRESVFWWDGTDQYGRPLPAGVYFVQIGTGGNSVTSKVTLVR